MAVEYEISSDVAVIKETGSVSQCARVTQMYSGQITYDDEAGSKFATATINGKSQRVMLCIAVNGTVNYDDVPSLYSTVDGHRCLNIVTPTETGTPDDVPSLYETVVIDGQNVRAVRCIMINKTPVYDGVSSVCTFTGDDGKTHTAQLVNKVTGGSVVVIIKGTSPLVLPDAIANSLSYVKAFGRIGQPNLPSGYTELQYITFGGTQYINTGLAINNNTRVLFDVKRGTSSAQSSYPWLGGVRDYVNNTNINKKTLEFSKSDSTKLYLQYATSGEITLNVPDTKQRHTYDFNKNELYIDENLIYTATQETFTGNTAVLLGAMYSQGSVSTASMFYGDVYRFKLWQDGTNLSMDLIPAKRNSDNVVGMYDIISGQFFTNAGTGTFTAGADVVPTPDAPIDIVSNNGVLKVKDSELPVGYRRVKDITGDGDAWILTDFYLKGSDTVRITVSGVSSTGQNLLGSYSGTSANNNYSLYISTQSAGCYLRYGANLFRPKISSSSSRDLVITPTGTLGFSSNSSWTSEEFDTEYKFSLFHLVNSTSNKFTGTITGAVVVDGRARFIPCERISDGELGYYETYAKKFYGNAGDGSFSTSGYDTSYMTQIYADGTVETINVHGKNLIDVADYTVPSGSGTNTLWTGSMTGTFRLSVDTSKVTSVGYPNQRFLYVIVNDSGTYVNYSNCDSIAISGTLTRISCIGSTGYARVSGKISLQLERGTTATPYEPYYNGGTATTEMLLQVGDYQDVQSILDGAITRNVGGLVLNGTENFETATATNCYSLTNTLGTGNFSNRTIVCSHFASTPTLPGTGDRQGLAFITNKGSEYTIAFGATTQFSTQALWQQFLADQYAAGTPVIVLYPLATATTESVTGQTLQVQEGDNYLEITQASLTGLELEVQYNAAVSLTIQEVEDANLDNNVTVTIQ